MLMNMDNLVVAVVLLVSLGTLTALLSRLLPSRSSGHHRRLHHITAVLSAAPSSTIVFRMPFLGRRHILTADPDNVQHILKTNFPNYPKGAYFRSTLDDLFGECIVNADGQAWRTQRLFTAREFTVSFLHFYGDTILDSEISERLLPFLAKSVGGGVIDLQDVLLRFALDNICRAAFTYDPECLSASSLQRSEFAENFDKAVFLMSHRIKDMLPAKVLWMKKALNIGNEREIKKSVEAVKRVIKGIVKEKMQSSSEGEEGDFLSRLTKWRGKGVDEEEYMGNMVAGVILAGRDTTSAVLTWFFWLVSTTPRVEACILEEISNINNRGEGAYESAREMPYTHAALCETMRLYPPIPVVVKEVQNDDVLPKDGTAVGRGDRVVILTYAMGRLERVWGPDWKEFRPERWLERDRMGWRFVGRDPYRFPVFNAGPRICLGKEMAFVQMKRVVSAVLGRFRVVPAAGEGFQPEFVFDLTAKMKGGFPVRLEDRLPIPSIH